MANSKDASREREASSSDRSRTGLFVRGVRDGFPIGLGYFAVAFSLGITARNAGFTAFQGFLVSLLNNASAGEYAGIALVAADAAYLEMALVIFITNARYLLMSCALSQKFGPDTPFYHRFLIGFDVTDEVFGLAIAWKGQLSPAYMYGAICLVVPCWASGTAVGVIAGNLLPALLVNALSVAIYGMFLAIIIPPARKDRVIAVLVLVSFAMSFAFAKLPLLAGLSSGTKTILLTVVISSAVALLFPVKQDQEEGENHDA